MCELIGECDICNKDVYNDSFMRVEDETNEFFVYHKSCWMKSKEKNS